MAQLESSRQSKPVCSLSKTRRGGSWSSHSLRVWKQCTGHLDLRLMEGWTFQSLKPQNWGHLQRKCVFPWSLGPTIAHPATCGQDENDCRWRVRSEPPNYISDYAVFFCTLGEPFDFYQLRGWKHPSPWTHLTLLWPLSCGTRVVSLRAKHRWMS